MRIQSSATPMTPLIAATFALLLPCAAFPAVWIGATGGEWGAPANWDSNPSIPNGPGVTVDINLAHTVNLTSPLTGYTFGTLATNIATGSVTIGTTSATTDVLTAQVGSGVPTIGVVNSAANIFFYANLEGTQGFNKTGAGKLTWRFNGADQNYSGDITISGGVLGINQNGSLGNDNNDIFIANGSRLLAEPGSNSGTITLPSTRTITLTGAQSQIGSGNAAVNLVINGAVTEDAAGKGLVKTDAGKVTLAGTISYTGETRIAGGTLALSGSAALPAGQNLRFNQSSAATLDLGGTSQTVRTIVMDNTTANRTITGGGSFLVNGDANLQLSANNGVTYDFSGVDSFTFDRTNRNFNVQTVNVASVTTLMDLNLAKSGINGGVNLIKATQILVGGGNELGNNGNTARLHLGSQNDFRATTFQVGGYNAGGVVDFQSGTTSPFLKLRGTDGSSALTTWKIGETSSGSRRGEGVVNLTGGSLDAIVTDLTIGRHVANANNADTSTLTMPAGGLEAATILIGEKTVTGTPILTSTLNQGGGTVKAGTVTLGKDAGAGATAKFVSTYNLTGGTLYASTITTGTGAYAADSSRTLNINGGTLRNFDASTNLALSGANSDAGGRLNVAAGASGGAIHADSGRSVSLGTNAILTGSGALNKTGAGNLVINSNQNHSYSGTLTVSEGTLQAAGNLGSAAVQVANGATLAPGSSPGALTLKSLSLGATSATAMEINGITAGTQHDQVVISGGALAYGGAMTITFGFTLAGPETFTLFNVSGATGVSGNYTTIAFAGEYTGNLVNSGPGSWTGNIGGMDWTFTNSSGVLSAVPEPSTYALLLGCCSLLYLMRRRRK